MSSTVIHPFLPIALLEELQTQPEAALHESQINSKTCEEHRHQFVANALSNCMVMPRADERVSRRHKEFLGPAYELCMARDRITLLQFYIIAFDIPAVYETLRMGLSQDDKDSIGMTALQFCMERLRIAYREVAEAYLNDGSGLSEASIRARVDVQRGIRIATLLIEQHADVNASAGAEGETPLSIALECSSWDLVKLLLHHGAHPIPFNDLDLPSESLGLYLQLLTAVPNPSSPRPPRPCPCWSGKTLAQCHEATPIPYPKHFLCRCGTRKSFGNCCARRKVAYMESWNKATNSFSLFRSASHFREPGMPSWVAVLQADDLLRRRLKQQFLVDPALRKSAIKLFKEFKRTFSDESASRPDDEPAFNYAHNKCPWLALPWCDLISKIEAKARMDQWNAWVDEYIASGKDKRAAFDIECMAKIGLYGGPLYPKCEAKGCDKYESRDVEKLKECSACKNAVYCSPECQKAHWLTGHKQLCTPATHTRMHADRFLPSQVTLRQTMVWMISSGTLEHKSFQDIQEALRLPAAPYHVIFTDRLQNDFAEWE